VKSRSRGAVLPRNPSIPRANHFPLFVNNPYSTLRRLFSFFFETITTSVSCSWTLNSEQHSLQKFLIVFIVIRFCLSPSTLDSLFWRRVFPRSLYATFYVLTAQDSPASRLSFLPFLPSRPAPFPRLILSRTEEKSPFPSLLLPPSSKSLPPPPPDSLYKVLSPL